MACKCESQRSDACYRSCVLTNHVRGCPNHRSNQSNFWIRAAERDQAFSVAARCSVNNDRKRLRHRALDSMDGSVVEANEEGRMGTGEW